MNSLSDAWSQLQSVARLAYEWSPSGVSSRVAQAITDGIVDRATGKADVAVIAWGQGRLLYRSMDWMELANDRADDIIYEPKSVDDMVNQVLAKVGTRTLRRLSINAHGSPGSQSFAGSKLATRRDDSTLELNPSLAKLAAIMTENTVTTLSGCSIGDGEKGEQLLRALAGVWGSEVRAASTRQNSLGSGLQGPVLACRPSGDEVKCIRAADESLLTLGWLADAYSW